MTVFTQLLKDFAAAVEVGDGSALAALFTEDGVYDDIFYGEFHGRDAIRGMVENIFWRDARDFLWEFRSARSGPPWLQSAPGSPGSTRRTSPR